MKNDLFCIAAKAFPGHVYMRQLTSIILSSSSHSKTSGLQLLSLIRILDNDEQTPTDCSHKEGDGRHWHQESRNLHNYGDCLNRLAPTDQLVHKSSQRVTNFIIMPFEGASVMLAMDCDAITSSIDSPCITSGQ